VRTFAFVASGNGWDTCGNEGSSCGFSGTKAVRYGAGSTFVYGSFTNGASCDNATFGDPAPGVAKHCEVSESELPPSIGIWTLCAGENQQCAFSNTKTVAYGARGSYTLALKTGGVNCSNAAFGDPIFG